MEWLLFIFLFENIYATSHPPLFAGFLVPHPYLHLMMTLLQEYPRVFGVSLTRIYITSCLRDIACGGAWGKGDELPFNLGSALTAKYTSNLDGLIAHLQVHQSRPVTARGKHPLIHV